ncbi:MAG: ChaN family lipoprotein [Arenicellales bacterium]|nr:ChaN family lipoprotein [Arenicellales bacterium]
MKVISLACLTLFLSTIFYSTTQANDDLNGRIERDLTPQINAAANALSNVMAPAVIYVGEQHDQLPYHLNQLAVIISLKERGLKVAIGMEMIQTPFQQHLDDYINGQIDFVTMLERTEYFTRWRYDARLYQPIFKYARQYNLPLIALNAPRELTDRVSEVGIAGLDPKERAELPDKLTSLDPQYRTLLEDVFKEHEEFGDMDIERFIEVQRSWDEIMGKKSAEFIRANPDHVLVVLAGVQHVANGYGIPRRVEKDVGFRGTIVLSGNERTDIPEGADVFLDLKEGVLPQSGRMGVFIKSSESGAIVSGFTEDSPAKEAGIEENDTITEVNGRTVERFEDIKLALWDKLPGDSVLLKVRRDHDTHLQKSFNLH